MLPAIFKKIVSDTSKYSDVFTYDTKKEVCTLKKDKASLSRASLSYITRSTGDATSDESSDR